MASTSQSSSQRDLRTFIEQKVTLTQTVGDASNGHEEVLTKLHELGVNNIEDLKFLEESDLKDVLKPVQIRKFLRDVQQESASKPLCLEMNKTTGLLPRPLLKAGQFKMDTVLQRMPEVNEILQNGSRLHADIRRHLVRAIVDHVRNFSHHTSKKDFEDIARSIVSKFPDSLEDRIDKVRIGSGYDSLLKQLVSRNENLNRTNQQKCSPSSSSSEMASDSDNGKSSKRKKIQQDSYGCMNWGPSLSVAEEEQQDKLRKELLEYYESESEPDLEFVYKKMEATYPLLRKQINSGWPVCKLLEDWPFLIEKNVLLSHCQQLVGIDIAKAVENFFLKKGVRMIRYFRSRVTEVRPYIIAAEKEKDNNNNLPAILPLVILCLQKSLGEEEDSLFAVVDEMSSHQEIKSKCGERPWPRLAMMGESVLAATQSVLVVDGEILGRFTSFLDAMALLFGVYYIFNIQYPKEATCTLEFLQRCSMGINPGSGMKCSKRRKGNSSVNPKVLKMINELADFEWTEEQT